MIQLKKKKHQTLQKMLNFTKVISPAGKNDKIVVVRVDLPICKYFHLLLYGVKLCSFTF